MTQGIIYYDPGFPDRPFGENGMIFRALSVGQKEQLGNMTVIFDGDSFTVHVDVTTGLKVEINPTGYEAKERFYLSCRE